MRMTRHTHNATRHTGGLYMNTNTAPRGARVQGTRDAAYLSTAYGITAHYTSSVPRCVCVAAITAIRPARRAHLFHTPHVCAAVSAPTPHSPISAIPVRRHGTY